MSTVAERPRRLFYLLGIPGAGKTTLCEAALAACARSYPGGWQAGEAPVPFAHRIYPGGCALGAIRPPFSGTDTLSLSVQPRALAWLASPDCPFTAVVAEGDRLANAPFFAGLRDAGWTVTVAFLDTPEPIAAARRAARGRAQAEAWVAGRVTKVHRLAAEETDLAWWLSGTAPLADSVALLLAHPVFYALAHPTPLGDPTTTAPQGPRAVA